MEAPLILYGAESIFTVEMLETARRLHRPIAAAIIVGEPEWDLRDLPIEPANTVPSSMLFEFVIPWVTPGMRWQRVGQAAAVGLTKHCALIDPVSTLSSAVDVGAGVYVNAGATVGACARLGEGVLLNRNSSFGHHSVLGPYVSLGPGAVVAARCRIGAGTMIGAGAVVAPGTLIGENCVVSVGAVVAKDVEAQTVVAGNPARAVRSGIAGYRDLAVPAANDRGTAA
jgi:UDP-3-O-[3-hydroxymyristoyl] glucosamine N-acyltransferase